MGAVEDLERFSITNSGELILKGKLDYERRIQHSFLVHVTDGYYVRMLFERLYLKYRRRKKYANIYKIYVGDTNVYKCF